MQLDYEEMTMYLSETTKMNPTFSLSRHSGVTGLWTPLDMAVSVTEGAWLIRDMNITRETEDRAILALTRDDIESLVIETGDESTYEFTRN